VGGGGKGGIGKSASGLEACAFLELLSKVGENVFVVYVELVAPSFNGPDGNGGGGGKALLKLAVGNEDPNDASSEFDRKVDGKGGGGGNSALSMCLLGAVAYDDDKFESSILEIFGASV